MALLAATAICLMALVVVEGGRVTRLSPESGSIEGATRLTIFGQGFAENQFNHEQAELGNTVTLLSLSRTRAVPCDVIPYYSTPSQIVCDTRASPSGADSYNIRIRVDGKWLGNEEDAVYCDGECIFEYQEEKTPTVTSVTPRFALPGTLLTIHGRVFTSRFADMEGSDPNSPAIVRIFAGDSWCDPIDPDTLMPYGIEVDSAGTGYVKCKPTSPTTGSQEVSFLVSHYGRSQTSPDALRVDSAGELYSFQSHTDLRSVSPPVGSTAGGTLLTLKGSFPADQLQQQQLSVTVGGVPCEIKSSSADVVTCQTNPAPSHPDGPKFYPGARGILREVWTRTRPATLAAVAKLNSTSRDYHSEVAPDACSPRQPSFGEMTSFSSRLRGFFVPPSDNNYTFYIKADDKAELLFSRTGPASAKQKIASCTSPTNSWTKYPEQRSAVFHLQRGKAYYLEANHIQGSGESHVTIGVKMQQTRFVSSQLSAAVNEKQVISSASTKLAETQIVNASDWDGGEKADVQVFRLGNETICGGKFRLIYSNVTTPLFDARNVTPSNIRDALNNLQPIKSQGYVLVASQVTYNWSTYMVSFYLKNQEEAQLLMCQTEGEVAAEARRIQKGKRGNPWFNLALSGRTSNDIHINSTAAEFEEELRKLFAWECHYQTPPDRALYYSGFEVEPNWPEPGDRVMEPYCGRNALKNPSVLFRGGQTKDMYGRILRGFDVSRYRQLCFAYKGTSKVGLKFLISFTDKSGQGQQAWREFPLQAPADGRWHVHCMDMFDQVIGDDYFRSSADRRYQMYVERIIMKKYGVQDISIDDVFIWRDAVMVQRTQPPALPNGHVIESVAVESLGPATWMVHLTPAACGTGIDLLQLANAVVVDGNSSSDRVLYANRTTNGTVLVSRAHAATPPIEGTFGVSLGRHRVEGIPANASAEHLKTVLENNLATGAVSVTRLGSCAGYQWEVEWSSTGGDQPTISVDGTGLTGNEVSINASVIDDGGLFLGPIPGDMLRLAEPEPQVTVTVKSVPSSCSERNCSFVFSPAATPSLSSVSPRNGTSGIEVTLLGSSFESNFSNVDVRIGGTLCRVTRSAPDRISCIVGESIGGRHEVSVRVNNKGFASSAGNVVFTYNVSVHSVSPQRSSVAGGTMLTIHGSGFGDVPARSEVLVGHAQCTILKSSIKEITCITSAHASGPAVVKVTVGNVTGLFSAFQYDSSGAATITAISPSRSYASRKDTLTIQGKGFGQSSPGNVTIGSVPCRVSTWSDALITCSTPTQAPGKYDIRVQVVGSGLATFLSRLAQFEYVLKVSGVSPKHGSIFGGTLMSVFGEGFSPNASANSVTLGDIPCEVLSSSNTKIMCRTGSSSRTHHVDNSGVHPEYGMGYAWSPKTVTISAGDFVQWSWANAKQTEVTYGVQQTRDPSTVEYDGTGFKSSRSGQGSFKFRFQAPGTYYYSSGPVDPNGALFMRGKVVVENLQSNSQRIEVKTGQFVAKFNVSDPDLTPSAGSNCSLGVSSAIPGCTAMDPLLRAPESQRFAFWECSTPEVTSIRPNTGVRSTVLIVDGRGFGPEVCDNDVNVGPCDCAVLSSNADRITCRIASNCNLEAGVPHEVSVHVTNRGFALRNIPSQSRTTFTLIPTVSAILPASGSLMGGTVIRVTGEGFSLSVDDNSMFVENNLCTLLSSSYTQLTCRTSPRDAPKVVGFSLHVRRTRSQCLQVNGCNFLYTVEETPRVDSVVPDTISGPENLIRLYGSGFPTTLSDVEVQVGNFSCAVTTSSVYAVECRVGAVVAGRHALSLVVRSKGLAKFDAGAPKEIKSLALVSGIAPSEGSVMGGTDVHIDGSGFDPEHTRVRIGPNDCPTELVTTSLVICRTPAHVAGSFELTVTTATQVFPSLRFAYRSFITPTVAGISPPSGLENQPVTIAGSGFGTDRSQLTVRVGNASCSVVSSDETSIQCRLPKHVAGTFDVVVHVRGKGYAAYVTSRVRFTYDIKLDNASPRESSFGGGRILKLTGEGFDSSTVVKICGKACAPQTSNFNELSCEVPAYTAAPHQGDKSCDVVVVGRSGVTASKVDYFFYKASLTATISSVTPRRGGTGGGLLLTIKGSGFSSKVHGNEVTIGGITCNVTYHSATELRCVTGARDGSVKTRVRVDVDGNGVATQDNAGFEYVDLWSSPYSWGYKDPPARGDIVDIRRGQRMVLDTHTPILAALIISGELVFDEKDVTLNAEKILIVNGGRLQVGTESQPFQHQARIVLHGHAMSKRLPIYGAKVLAVREGSLDLHGRHVGITWTHLAKTARPGDTSLELTQQVTWQVGDRVVLASTSQRLYENEELNVTGVSSDGKTIDVTPALKYTHVSVVQSLGGWNVETRAEVGLLTRNVVVEGSVNDEWTDDIAKCPKEFKPGQFATQTCFYGRYGREKIGEQFGSQIMVHAKRMSQGLVTGRLSHVEVRNAGQAFNLGRYPIHFHMSGDVTGSYVRGCAIHHTFNRAVTIHGVRGLLVERNVAYHVMGHAFFIEDGIETGNTIQYNLGVFVMTSSSLLNVDVTPAAFWITNPNNTVRHNSAAGGSHFGFWYNMPVNPGGPSFTKSVCPRKVPLAEFTNNTAHSFGRYGLWIFPTYVPVVGGECWGKSASPARFHSFLAYNNLKGFEIVEGGAIQAINFTVLDNIEAGLEFSEFPSAAWGQDQGPLIKDSLIVGRSAIGPEKGCTVGGLVTPQASYLTVSGVTFVNFAAPSCAALRCCSFCKDKQGGFTTKFQNIRFSGSQNKAAFQWEHECVLEDLDGSLSGIRGGSLVPWNSNLPPDHCNISAVSGAAAGSVKAGVCDATVKFRRMSWNEIYPSSLEYRDALLSNEFGTSVISWMFKRLTHKKGWMATLVLGNKYNLTFRDATHLSNLSYSATFYEFGEQDHVWLSHSFSQKPDTFITTGKVVNMSSGIPSAPSATHGDWYFDNATNEFTYIVTGRKGRTAVDPTINLQLRRCYYRKCITPVPPPPPKKRPAVYQIWSDPEAWYGTEPGYGGYNKQLPQNGSDVMIKEGWWMVADTELPKMNLLVIYGTLELDPRRDFVLSATYIIVGHQGNLIIGWEDQPMLGSVLISLSGDRNTPDISIQDGPNLGSKALGVFGNAEVHGLNRSVYWTRLSQTSEPGENVIHLREPVDWKPGEEIVIATTTYEPYETEIVSIAAVSPDRKTVHLDDSLKFKHLSATYQTGNWNYSLAAEVGLLTRNVVIEGADDVDGMLEKESYGCRVLIRSFGGNQASYDRRVRIENVQFRRCGQEGYSDYDDPRFSLALLDVGPLKDSYIRGNAFHDGFNSAIGVLGTSDVSLSDNVIHHTVGTSVRVAGKGNQLNHNLVVLSVSPATYKGRQELHNLLWHAAFDVSKAYDVILRNNAAAGSERIGFHIRGEACYPDESVRFPANGWTGNVAHSTLHGVHIGYNDGIPECLKISGFLSWMNWDYGVFGTPTSRVIVEDCVIVDSKTGILINIWLPAAVSHVAADKFVHLNHVLVVGTSPSFDCASDSPPRNSYITSKVRSPRAREGGHVGFLLTTFMSGGGLAPKKPWNMVMSAPALRGVTKLNGTGFAHFGVRCTKSSVAITTNPGSGDAFHPVEVRALKLFHVSPEHFMYIRPPALGLVNPSDCVDMDCDGNKHVVFKDLDGSLTGQAGGSVIAKAEFEWNGDPRRGLGDYRISKAMLMTADGRRLNASRVAPNHGIVRGTRDRNTCTWNAGWNAYKCHSLDHEMFIIESLDADTMVRRLSPVALSADGYTDLLNGPMDHGWCHGYTCQERLSTFFSVVATGFNYTLYFTGTNPQNLRLTLLNSDPSQVLRIAIWYPSPQRLDVYRKGVYIQPTNARLKGGSFTYLKQNPTLPDDQFEPPLTSISGANYFDRRTQMLFVVVRGRVPVDIRTMPVIQLEIGCKPVDIDEFFEKNLAENLASLLQIDKSRIRVVEIVSASTPIRKRRSASEKKTTTIRIEIGDVPFQSIPYTPEERFNSTEGTTPTEPPSATPKPEQNMTALCNQLQILATKTVEAAQTGEMASALRLDVLTINVTDPEPPRVDPTGGHFASNGTGGPSNGTLRYDQLNAMKEGNRTSARRDYLVPIRLRLVENPGGANETVAFSVQPALVMLDIEDNLIPALGHGTNEQWFATASIKNGTGDPESTLAGNTSVPFLKGKANFTNLSVSHSGRGYVLEFKISYPLGANFTVVSRAFDVRERVLYFTLTRQPSDANETVPFGRQPLMEVRDAADGSLVTNTGWKGRQWICRARILNQKKNQGNLNGSSSITFRAGVASFTDLSIDYEGRDYVLEIEAFTSPASNYKYLVNTSAFIVNERLLAIVITQQPGDCNDTVPCGFQPVLEIRDIATNRNAGNLGWRGRKWRLEARTLQGPEQELVGKRIGLEIPPSGRVQFRNISFYDVATDLQMQFNVTVLPTSASYTIMAVSSQKFDVNSRTFYLAVAVQPADANQTVVFGTQPVIEVRDVGTRRRASPLKQAWWVAVDLGANPKPGVALLNGTRNVSVVDESAPFTDLLITRYGTGFVLRFQSTDGHIVETASFEVNYVNDYSPKFFRRRYNTSISETALIGTFVIRVNATDKDKGPQGHVTYSIVSGDDNKDFVIDKASGVITTRAELDRERSPTYRLSVRASDGAVPDKVRFTDVLVTVDVGDVNDNSPAFVENPFVCQIEETARIGDVVVRARAVDIDTGSNAVLRYSVSSGNDAGYFEIESGSGDIVVNRSLDMESARPPVTQHVLGLNVTDLGMPVRLYNTSAVRISITPVNEYPPRFTHRNSSRFNIQENLPVPNGLVLIDVNATDKDYGPQGQVWYSFVSGNQDGKFNISREGGVVTLVSPLDFEVSQQYKLVVRAADSGPAEPDMRAAYFTFIVNVVDLNDNPPRFSQEIFHEDVLETSAVDDVVLTASASDADSGSNGKVRLEVVSGNEAGFFSLNGDTGQMQLVKSLDLDAANSPPRNFTLVIKATDCGQPVLDANATFHLKVVSVNEYEPRFTVGEQTKRISEATEVGTLVFSLTATDRDSGLDGKVRYSIDQGDEERSFRIDPDTGEVFVHTPLDRERKSTYDLRIRASDSPSLATNQRRSYVIAHVLLSDVNDNKPKFQNSSYYAAVLETAVRDEDVVTVQAVDPDQGTNGRVRYSIIAGNTFGFFKVDANTGTISAARSLDLETQAHVNDLLYVLKVQARDQGQPTALSNAVLVTIEIKSVNEFTPKLEHPGSLYVKIPEKQPAGSDVVKINATDQDFGLDGLLDYSISAGNDVRAFSIDRKSGLITVARELEYEIQVRYVVVVQVTDSGALISERRSAVATVTVRLTNANDSGGVDVLVEGVAKRLTPRGDPAEFVGLRTNTSMSIRLLYENGSTEPLPADDSRVSIAYGPDSHRLFTVMNSSGRRLVQANNAGHLGRGTLVVRVRGAYSVRVPISVVGFSVLEISANLYPSTEPVNQVTTLKRVARSDGSFQLAVLALSVVLSDNTTFDVSAMNTTSYHVVQNDAGVVATLGPKPRNLLVVSRGSDHGTLTVYGEFAGRPSRRLDLVVSSEVVTIQKVLSARVDGLVDQTLIGLAGSAHAQIEVRLLMSDGSQLLVRNFSAYSGLVDVEVDRTEVVRLDVDTGRVVLLRDYHAAVHITVSASSNATGRATVAFFCNTEPAVGGVDIGQRSGPPMPKLAAHDRVEIPLRVNAGSTKLLAFDLKITYDPNKAKFLAVADDTPYHHEPGVILLANVIPPDAVDSGSICSLLFESVQPGVLELQASVNSLLDEKLDYIGARDPRTTPGSCSQGPPGDVNRDCVFDIKDAALTLLYSLDIEREGRGNANHKLFPDVTSRVEQIMDFNVNGFVDRADAYLLAGALFDLVRFTEPFQVTLPDHTQQSAECSLKIQTKLRHKNGHPATEANTQVFFEMASEDPKLSEQLKQTELEEGASILTLYGGQEELYGGIVKVNIGSDGVVTIASKNSALHTLNLGLSMIQVTQSSSVVRAVVSPLFTFEREPEFTVALDIPLTSNSRLKSKAHSPQIRLNVTESTPNCLDPWEVKTVRLTFEGEFSSLDGKEEVFIASLLQDLTRKVERATVENVRLRPGSILVYFDVSAPRSQLGSVLGAIWDLVMSGYSVHVAGKTFVARKAMQVDDKDYFGRSPGESEPASFPTAAVVSACVGIAVVAAVIVVACVIYRKRLSGAKRGLRAQRFSRLALLSRKSKESNAGSVEMTPIGHTNYQVDSSDDEPLPSPRLPGGAGHTSVSPLMGRDTKRAGSAASRVSVEAWTDGRSTPESRASKPFSGRVTPVSSSPWPTPLTGKRLTGPLAGGKASPLALPPETSSNEGSPFNLSPAVHRKGRTTPTVPSGRNGGNSSDEERVPRSRPESAACFTAERSPTPPSSGLLRRAALHRRLLKPGSSHSDWSDSAGSSPACSGRNTPRLTSLAQQPDMAVSSGLETELRVEEESFTVRLPVNLVKTDDSVRFCKFGFVEFPSDASLADVRQKLWAEFAGKLRGKQFFFQDDKMTNIEPSTEDKTVASNAFKLSVLIKLATQDEECRSFCPCGKVAHFLCTACYSQGYCDPRCQVKDWDQHKATCEDVTVV